MRPLLWSLLWVVLWAGSALAQQEEVLGAIVEYQQGQAALINGLRAGESVPLAEGQRLQLPATIRLEQGGRLGLRLPDGSVFRLAGAAMARIAEAFVFQGERGYTLELSRGEGWLAIREFQGRSDAVTLTLPGTTLRTSYGQTRLRVGPDRRSVIAVYSGTLQVTGDFKDPYQSTEEPPHGAGGSNSGEALADRLMEGEGAPTQEPAAPVALKERVLHRGEQVRVGLGGTVTAVEAVAQDLLRADSWALWNLSRDAKQGFVSRN